MLSSLKGAARLTCLALMLGSGLSAAAQITTGSISGTITDNTGAPVKGATIVLKNTDQNAKIRTLTTNGEGFFTGQVLPLGTYEVVVTYTGFKVEDVKGLVLHANDNLTVNKALQVGSENSVVTVEAEPVQLNFEDATSQGLISGDQLNELVLSNRNYEEFLQLQPGVAYTGGTDQISIGPTAPSGSSGTVAFSVNGGRTTSNNWTIDGADNLDRGANLTTLVYPSVDAIAEVKTLRGQYTAEFGGGASGQVNVITKSGTNLLHGTAYEFFRNDFLDANSWANKNNAVASARLPRSKYRYHDYGYSIGGPVLIPHVYDGRDKTFFFFSQELRSVIQYTTGTAYVPTQAERNGDFTNAYYLSSGTSWTAAQQGPVNVCTAYTVNQAASTGSCTATGTKVTNFSPTAQAYLKDLYKVVPLPDSANDIVNNLDPHTIKSTARNFFKDNQVLVRVDQRFGQRLNAFYRYIHDTLPVESGTGTFTAVPLEGVANTSTKQPGTTHMGHATYVFTPTLLVDGGYSYSSGAILTDPVGALTTANSPDVKIPLPYTNTLGVIPTLSISGLTPLGSTGIYRDYSISRNVFANLVKTWGTHTFKVGATYFRYQKKENATGGNQGSFSFAQTNPIPINTGMTSASVATSQAFAQFLLGGAQGSTNGFSQTSLAITPDIRVNSWEGYVQDNWKILPRLSLNLGVRYSYYGQPTDVNGRINNFDPSTYSASKAPTIASGGLICFTGTCANLDGLNSGTPNPNADYIGVNYINGMIFGSPNASNNNQGSSYGNKIGQVSTTNFAPRFGFAYDLFGDGRTALRGGFGWSYDQSSVSYYETAIFSNPPAVSTFATAVASLDDPAGGVAATTSPSTTPGLIIGAPLNFQSPYVQQYSLDIQQMITPSTMLDIGYFGTFGKHLLGRININEPTPGSFRKADGSLKANPILANPGTYNAVTNVFSASPCAYPNTAVSPNIYSGTPAYMSTLCDRTLNQVKPYLGYFAIDAIRSIFSSNYNSLQATFTKRFSGKTYLTANYTWSKALTNAQNDYTTPPQNTYDIDADYGRAAGDRTHIFSFNGVYELPWYREQKNLVGRLIGGWEMSGILQMYSGLALSPSASTGSYVYYGYTNPLNNKTSGNLVSDSGGLGISGNTNAAFRPDQIANPNIGYGGHQIHTKSEWFYRGAFDAPLPTDYRPGNAKRGSIIGPGFVKANIGIFRNFRIYNRVTFQLRGEAFNVFNHTNLSNPNTTSTSTSFGLITSARDNRILQIAGKIRF